MLRHISGQRTAVFAFLVAVLALIGAVALLSHDRGDGQGSTIAAASSASPTASIDAAPSSPAVEPTPSPSPTPTPTPSPTPSPSPKVVASTSDEPEQLTGYVWPLRDARITSRFSRRSFGGFIVIDEEEYHDGLDLATFCGDKVRAAHDGVVLYAGRNFDVFLGYRGDAAQVYARLEQNHRVKTLPVVIVIDDGNGYRSVYVHLSDHGLRVDKGDHVKAGEVIGLEGDTGFSTGCHLHYGLIRMDGEWQTVVPELVTQYRYPPLVRERVDPLRVLPWDDQYAPAVLRPAPSPLATPAAPGGVPGAGASPAPATHSP